MSESGPDYRELIVNMYNSDEYQRLKQYYAKRSMMDIFNVARSELAHSSMIGWLLDPNETHGLGLFPVRKLLHLIAMAKLKLVVNKAVREKSSDVDNRLMDKILTDGYQICEAEVIVEKSIDTTGDRKKDRRIDILVIVELKDKTEGSSFVRKLPIIIENKVGSKEHDDQTVAYRDWAIREYAKSELYFAPLFVFLTPEATIDLEDASYKPIACKCDQYIRINYQYIVDHLIEPCLKQDVGQDTKRVLRDYLRSLTYTYIKGDIKEGGNSMMALNHEERQLLVELWKNNKILLGAVISALADCPEIEVDSKKRKQMRELGNDMSRDTTKYQVCGDGIPLPKNRAVLAVVKKYIASHPDITFENLKRVFSDELAGSRQSFGVVRSWAEIISKNYTATHYFDGNDEKIQLSDGTEVFVLSNWTKDDFKIFSDYSNRKLGIRIDVAAK